MIQGSTTVLLPLLEYLTTVEETVVRNMSIKSLNALIPTLTD